MRNGSGAIYARERFRSLGHSMAKYNLRLAVFAKFDFENLRPEHDNENNCGFMSSSAIIDAGFIILLFRETRNMILKIRSIEEIASLANYLYEPETRIERIYEKRDEICRHFWSFYKEHGNLKCSFNSY